MSTFESLGGWSSSFVKEEFWSTFADVLLLTSGDLLSRVLLTSGEFPGEAFLKETGEAFGELVGELLRISDALWVELCLLA